MPRKWLRVSFRGGLNTIQDKQLLPEGFADVLDNVDLRSGMPRTVKEPVKVLSQVPTVPSTTTKIFNYRGRWLSSDNWRDYVAEYTGGIEKIYWTEQLTNTAGAFNAVPQKLIGGTQVPLGQTVPKVGPTVASGSDLVPGNLTAVAVGGAGSLPAGTYYYRVAAETEDGILPPSAEISVRLEATSTPSTSGLSTSLSSIIQSALSGSNPSAATVSSAGAVCIGWAAVPGAKAYHIFGRNQSNEQHLATVYAGTTAYTDNGSASPSGAYATSYEQTQPMTYAYSYQRTVEGDTDESGLSPLSQTVTGANSRTVTRDYLNDGFFSQSTTQTATVTQIRGAASIYSAITVTAVEYNAILRQTKFTTSAPHNLATDDFVIFNGSAWGDPNFAGKTFQVNVPDSTHFVIQNVFAPTGALSTVFVCRTRVVVNGGTAAVDKDAMYLNIVTNSGQTLSGLFRVYTKDATGANLAANTYEVATFTVIDTTSFTTAVAQWTPNNGYIQYWNLYRTSDAGTLLLVKQIEPWKATYADAKPQSALGAAPTSYYEATDLSGSPIVISYKPPPTGLKCLTDHYGMTFGVIDNTVRWTPIGQRDAWPDAYQVSNFTTKPLALASYGTGLIVLCQDGIYRIDGNDPNSLSLSRTQAVEGCLAPFTVQSTTLGLMYLSRRGVMVFDGMHSKCLTDERISTDMLLGASSLKSPVNYFWYPTLVSYFYGAIAGPDSFLYTDTSVSNFMDTVPTPFPLYNIRSFYWRGRYFLFWNGTQNHAAHTCMCIDTQVEGLPITTYGMKAIDVIVNELGDPYALFPSPGYPIMTVTLSVA